MPVSATSQPAQERSQFFQLMALVFVHPVESLHELLISGEIQRGLQQSARDGFSVSLDMPQVKTDFVRYEADYIELFQVGHRGRPRVHLNAGEYDELARDHSRPEFLLVYAGWYRHFGLAVNEDEGANELPDHLVCQLELMAWLSHLESQTLDRHHVGADDDLVYGYRKAQLDFCERHLLPFMECLLQSMRKQPVPSMFLDYGIQIVECLGVLLEMLHAQLEAAPQLQQQSVSVVNLWE